MGRKVAAHPPANNALTDVEAPELEIIDMLELDRINPFSPHAEHGPTESPAAPHVTPRTYEVLIVDDEPCLRGLLRISMMQRGFTVWLAAGGPEAIDLYRRHHETIDVVLMDVRMPVLDGPETLAALQSVNPQVRCCFMTGDPGNYTEERLLDLGAVAVIRKPFGLAEVGQQLWKLAAKPAWSRWSNVPPAALLRG
jgi:CheY-like chemotaxis protein